MTIHEHITITRREDLQVGDNATFSYRGREFTGIVWSQGGQAMIGKTPLGTVEDWDPDLDFIGATRERPSLPTEPGSVIEITAINEDPIEPTIAMLDAADDWVLAYRRDERWEIESYQITAWRTMKVVPI